MSCLELLGGLNNVLLTGAAIAGAVTAMRGLSTWKKQLKWQSDHDLARKILFLIFKHRDAIATVRHPAIWSAETEAALAGKEEFSDYDQKRFAETAAIYEKRWEKVTDVRAELYPALLEADIIWGSAIKDLVKPVFDLEIELRIVLQVYLRAINPNAAADSRKAANDALGKKRGIMYDNLGEEDEFRNDYQAGLEPLELFLRKKLGGS